MELTPRDKKMLMVLGVVAVLAAVVLFVFVLGGGEEVSPPTGGQTGASPTVSPTTTPTRTPGLAVAGRDIFSIPPALGPTPSGTVSPSPSATVSPSAPATPSHTTIGGHSVSLVDVFVRGGTDMVQVEVDGVVYTKSEGQSFDGGFRVTSIGTACASFTHNGNPFTLCVSPQK